MDDIIASMRGLGIEEGDIQTQSMSVYQEQEVFYENGVQRTRPGQWHVGNSIEVTVRDVSQVSEVNVCSIVLKQPMSMDQISVLMKHKPVTTCWVKRSPMHRLKAESLAQSQNLKLGKILQITETGAVSNYPIMYDRAMGGGWRTCWTRNLTSARASVWRLRFASQIRWSIIKRSILVKTWFTIVRCSPRELEIARRMRLYNIPQPIDWGIASPHSGKPSRHVRMWVYWSTTTPTGGICYPNIAWMMMFGTVIFDTKVLRSNCAKCDWC